jgi:SSS family solute:Na+ symporter
LVTYLTRPVASEHLLAFYRRVYPGGPGWRSIAAEFPGREADGINARTFINIFLGVVISNCFLIGTGKWILGAPWVGVSVLLLAFAAGAGLYRSLRTTG